MIVILMGVSGTGKTSIGRRLSTKLGIPFYDADDFHPLKNIQKMEKGIPLQDTDRIPWLEQLNRQLQSWGKEQGAILACSALKESYRKLLMHRVNQVHWVYLQGSKSLIQERINNREGHFMKSEMLASQFATLEPPSYGLHLSIDDSIASITSTILHHLTHA